ncbi:MAG TPA: glycosyltransferase family 4 protein [Candidatus Acidoferrales bacterium]|nr:glycosyltransferase family 4 protein [Candidatus Acidoferrales bacterium]
MTPGIVFHKVPSVPGPQAVQFPTWMLLNTLRRIWDRKRHGMRYHVVLSPGINCLDADAVIIHALFFRLRDLSRGEQRQLTFLRRLHRAIYYRFLAAMESHIYSDPSVSVGAVSQRTASLVESKFGRKNVPDIPNGVDAKQFSPSARLDRRSAARNRYGFEERELVLLLIGNDWFVKGLPAILDAMALCPALPLRLLVAGSDHPQQHQAYAERLGLGGRCVWMKPETDPLNFMAAADVYVSPTCEDAFALPPLEAMASGLPVITSVNNGGSQIITNGVDGFVLQDAKDVSALALLFGRLHEEPEFRHAVGQRAARTAEKYSWDRHAAGIWELLRHAYLRKATGSEKE